MNKVWRVRFPQRQDRWVETSSYKAADRIEAMAYFSRIHRDAGPVALIDADGQREFFIVNGGDAYTIDEWAAKIQSEKPGKDTHDDL